LSRESLGVFAGAFSFVFGCLYVILHCKHPTAKGGDMSQTVSIRLSEEVIESLDKLAKITDRSKSWLMGHAIEQYVEHESWQIQAIESTLAKVKTGEAEFANHDAVSDWLQSWGTESEGKPPVCK
jgi:predicted transcriptional regulator